MIYMKPIRAAILHVPKAGGSSINHAFRNTPYAATVHPAIFHNQHPRFEQLVRADPDHADWYTFAVIRNPWEWVFSYWRYYRQHPEFGEASEHARVPFDQWLHYLLTSGHRKTSIPHSQKDYIFSPTADRFVEVVVTLDQLPVEWSNLRNKIEELLLQWGHPPIHLPTLLPHENRSGRSKEWLGAYPHQEIIDIVPQLFPEDMLMSDWVEPKAAEKGGGF